jgi:hypothetical protein
VIVRNAALPFDPVFAIQRSAERSCIDSGGSCAEC